MKTILLLAALILPARANAQVRRTVMEALQTSNNALFISSIPTGVYIQAGGSMTVVGNLGVGGALNTNGITLSKTAPIAATLSAHSGFDGYAGNTGGIATGGINGTLQTQRVNLAGDMMNTRRLQAGQTTISNVPDFLSSGDLQTVTGGLNWTYAALADMNQDGFIDIVFTENANHVYVQLGAGSGFIGTSYYESSTYGSSSSYGGMDVGDINGDGLPDIVQVNAVDGVAITWLNRGVSTATTFATAFSGPLTYSVGTANTNAFGVKLGDLNGDGRPDIAVNRLSSNLLVTLMNNTTGGFNAPVTYVTGNDPQSLVIADLNNDSRNDIVIACPTDNEIGVYMNIGNGVFGSSTAYALGSVLGTDYGGTPSALAVGDFNRDNKLDLLVSNQGTIASGDSTVTRLLGNGSGGFTSPVNFYACQFASDVKVADLNGDGLEDALSVCNNSQHSMSYYVGNGTGTFNTIATRDMTGGNFMNKMVVGDINSDGKIDVVFGVETSGQKQLLAITNQMIYAQASTSRVGISTGAPQATLDVSGTAAFGTTGRSTFSLTGALSAPSVTASTTTTTYLTMPTSYTPASSTVVGSTGSFSWDASYLYLWISSASVKRIALGAF